MVTCNELSRLRSYRLQRELQTWSIIRIGFTCNTIILCYSCGSINTSLNSSTSTLDRHENDNSSTAHQFSCCMHRLKRSLTSPLSPGPQVGTLTTASGRDDAVDKSPRQELSTSSSYSTTAVAVSLMLITPYY